MNAKHYGRAGVIPLVSAPAYRVQYTVVACTRAPVPASVNLVMSIGAARDGSPCAVEV